MIHEVIIALSGVNSELLKNIEACVDLKEFIHPSEKVLLNKILTVAKDYKLLKDFIDCNCGALLSNECELQSKLGLYIQAFCGGLDESLEPYRQEILTLERNVLNDPRINLITIFSQIDGYLSIFAVLTSLVSLILSKKIHGCQLLQLLHENAVNAVDETKIYIQRILKRCYTVFLKQTMNWLINGELEDPFNEFIIQKYNPPTSAIKNTDPLNVPIVENIKDPNENEFRIVIDLVPVFINYSLANDILFVGQIVKILNEKPSSSIENCDGVLIFGDRHEYFFELFVSLKEQPFIDTKGLDELVQDIRKCVVEHLWQVANEEDNLYEELQLLKNFHLLGCGQFFKKFLMEASVFSLYSSVSQFSQGVFSSLNEVMNEIVTTDSLIDERVLTSFSFKLESSHDIKCSDTTDIIWSSIKLQYTPKWPLNLIFTSVALEHYNKLFLFLLRVKRCHMEIHNVWKKDMKNKSLRHGKAWTLRNELMFLINNLQYYLQVDVIETEYNNLINETRKTKDFKQIEILHNMFLLNILSHSFLLDVPVNISNSEALAPTTYSKHFYNILMKNIRICEKFCIFSLRGGSESHEEEINKLDRSFQKYKNIFMCFLAEFQMQPFKQHASKLLLRLNFNNWVRNILEIPR